MRARVLVFALMTALAAAGCGSIRTKTITQTQTQTVTKVMKSNPRIVRSTRTITTPPAQAPTSTTPPATATTPSGPPPGFGDTSATANAYYGGAGCNPFSKGYVGHEANGSPCPQPAPAPAGQTAQQDLAQGYSCAQVNARLGYRVC
jgi:hypothetical protein